MELEQRIKGQTGEPAFILAAAGIGLVPHPIKHSFPGCSGNRQPLRRSTDPSNAARYWPDSARASRGTKRGAMEGANAAKSPCH
jgi:hypothetical protein